MTEQKAYEKFKTRINNQNDRVKLFDTIKQYYVLSGDPYYTPEFEDKINNMTTEDIKKLCLELCGESINRDMIEYIIKGTRGDMGQKLYKMLK